MMPIRERAGFAGAILVLVILGFQSIERWTVIDSVLTSLKTSGPVGAYISGILLSPVLPLVIAVASIALILESRRENKEQTPPPVSSKSESNPSQTQTGISLVQHIHQPGVEPKQVPRPIAKPEEPRPNMRCLGPITTRLRLGMEGHGLYEDAEGRFEESHPAALVCFRNESSTERQVKPLFNVRASIIFADDSGQEMGTGMAEACWRGDKYTINFPLEETQCVVVAILVDGAFTCPYVRHVSTRMGPGLLTEAERLGAYPKTIEVRLIKESQLLLPPCTFDFSVVDGRPVLSQRSPRVDAAQ